MIETLGTRRRVSTPGEKAASLELSMRVKANMARSAVSTGQKLKDPINLGKAERPKRRSPTTPLGEEWNGVLRGAAVSMRYDAATDSVQHNGTQHALRDALLRAGGTSLEGRPRGRSGELGPDKLGDLAPGQEASSTLRVDSEPKLAGVSFDGYVAHIEVYDCSGPRPHAS